MKFPLSKMIFYRRLFLAQCINHGIAIFLTGVWVFIGLSVGQETHIHMRHISEIDINAGFAFLLILYFSGLISRVVSILFFGSTLGFEFMKLEPNHQSFSKISWMGVFWESLHLPILATWVLEWVLRFKGHKLWNDLDLEKSALI